MFGGLAGGIYIEMLTIASRQTVFDRAANPRANRVRN
jgi:hypothetical protein